MHPAASHLVRTSSLSFQLDLCVMLPFKRPHDSLTMKMENAPSSSDSKATASISVLKAAHRKVDIRMLIWYSFVYPIMRMNVNNITNTAIMNLETDTDIRHQLGNLSSLQWAWALSIFWYPYMVFEPFATLLLKRFGPSIWMSRIMLTWGIVSMCQGATRNYAGILACRFFLGVAEAGFWPGVLYHLSFWYPAEKLPLRIAFLYACGMSSGTISGLLAYALSFMDGVGGLSGWRWVRLNIFILLILLIEASYSSLKVRCRYCALCTPSYTYRTTHKPRSS
jgi:MFS family permease